MLHHLHSGASIFWVFMKHMSKQLINSNSISLLHHHQFSHSQDTMPKTSNYLSTLGLQKLLSSSLQNTCGSCLPSKQKAPNGKVPLYTWLDTRTTKPINLFLSMTYTKCLGEKSKNRAMFLLSQNTPRALHYFWCTDSLSQGCHSCI